MQNIQLGAISKLIIHNVGNKANDEGTHFADSMTDFVNIEEEVGQLIANNFKFDELFNFHFVPTLDLNPVYQFVKTIFKENSSFIDQSRNCARYLYDKSSHPKIKGGEFCMVYIRNCQVNEVTADALAFIKSENKETILKVTPSGNGFDMHTEKGININKLDKGCLIFNIDPEKGFVAAIVDQTNRSAEAQYWREEFFNLKVINNEFHQTNEFLSITKKFVTSQLPEDFEVTKTEQIGFLNRSVDYFKTHETFDKQGFEQEVFADGNVIESFRKFDNSYRVDNELELADSFEISDRAVKKQAKVFKNVLKLDRNFDIYIKGNRKLIEQGIELDGRKFYKIYYDVES
ncbi:nucleoid-associated protein [Pedobacter gandavensis]|uniref:nucleoid-associated protein n=1 Tax=Pedobacter gandavensis TaxID=2679963 RepID=UPI00292F1D38|nr:nucleoid-associated protein [Pedobacter gandavensis]